MFLSPPVLLGSVRHGAPTDTRYSSFAFPRTPLQAMMQSMKRRFSGDPKKKDGAGPAAPAAAAAKPAPKDWTKSEIPPLNNPHLPLHRRFVVFEELDLPNPVRQHAIFPLLLVWLSLLYLCHFVRSLVLATPATGVFPSLPFTTCPLWPTFLPPTRTRSSFASCDCAHTSLRLRLTPRRPPMARRRRRRVPPIRSLPRRRSSARRCSSSSST